MVPASSSRPAWLAIYAVAMLVVVALGFAEGPIAAAGATVLFAAPTLGLLSLRVAQQVGSRRGKRADVVPPQAEAFPSLATWIFIGAIVHVLLAITLDLSGIADSLAPDHKFYRHWGQLIVLNGSRPITSLQGEIGYNPTSVYYYFNAIAYFLAGSRASLLMGIANGTLHLLTAYLAASIAHQLYGASAARTCFLLVAFFPSLVVYSTLNIRDALSWLLITAALRGALMVREPARLLAGTLLLSAGIVGMGFVRPYIMLMLLVSFGAAQLLTRPKRLPYAIVTLCALALVGAFAGPRVGVSLDLISSDGLRELQIARATLDGGGSAAGFSGDVSSPGQAMLMLPKGLAFFLLSPFPWQVSNSRQALAVPEVFLWLGLLVLAMRQVLRDSAVQATKIATLFFPALAISLTYALMEGNAGTANRHRAQMAMVVMVFASRPLAAMWKSRREQSRRMAVDAPALRRT